MGLSIALRAFSVSAAIRLLSSSSLLCLKDNSSNMFERSLDCVGGEVYGCSGTPGVIIGVASSRHCIIAFASLRGPTGLAT